MSIFQGMSPADMGSLILQARERVIYSAPSISDNVASALINRYKVLGQKNGTVILDYDEGVFRLGYGRNEAIQMLVDAGVEIRKQKGLRIGTLLIDDMGWAFSLAPMAVESQNQGGGVNTIQLNEDQVKAIVRSVTPPKNPRRTNALYESGPDADVPGVEIGSDILEKEEIKVVTKSITDNPPQAFDLQRVVQIYQTHLQFVEIELEGGRIEQRTLKFSNELKEVLFAGSKEVEKKVRASYKLIEGLELQDFNALRDELEKLRKDYAPSLGKRLGRVLLKTRKAEFNGKVKDLQSRLEEYCNSSKATIKSGIKKSLDGLAEELSPIVQKNPPQGLRARCSKVTKEIAKQYLFNMLMKSAPSADKLLDKTRLHCTYKDVTYEMLKESEFQKQIKKEFPYEEWVKPLDELEAVESK
ncbi:hypothetical protein ACWJJH_20065 [Endozoicomonadaceae bacterium StTr2]